MDLVAQLARVSEAELDLFTEDMKSFEDKILLKKISMSDWYLDSINRFERWNEASEKTDEDDTFMSLYHFWQGIIYILTNGSMEEIEDDVEGSSAINALGSSFFHILFLDSNSDFVDCPITSFTSEDVKEINYELQKFDTVQILNNLNGNTMNNCEVQPMIWAEQENIETLIVFFNDLKRFYQKASENNEAILTLMNMQLPKITIENSIG
jgi:Domain of unknown function (DUF1877)